MRPVSLDAICLVNERWHFSNLSYRFKLTRKWWESNINGTNSWVTLWILSLERDLCVAVFDRWRSSTFPVCFTHKKGRLIWIVFFSRGTLRPRATLLSRGDIPLYALHDGHHFYILTWYDRNHTWRTIIFGTPRIVDPEITRRPNQWFGFLWLNTVIPTCPAYPNITC
jgi:hypothetical protein